MSHRCLYPTHCDFPILRRPLPTAGKTFRFIDVLMEIVNVTMVSSSRKGECCERNRCYKAYNLWRTAFLTGAVPPSPSPCGAGNVRFKAQGTCQCAGVKVLNLIISTLWSFAHFDSLKVSQIVVERCHLSELML